MTKSRMTSAVNCQGQSAKAGRKLHLTMLISIWMVLALLCFQTENDQTSLKPRSDSDNQLVAAVVDDYVITVARVKQHVAKTLGDKKLRQPFLVRVQQEALEHLIDRHIVLRAINGKGATAGPAEIKLELTKLQHRLDEVDQTLEQHLAGKNMTHAELEYEHAWRIAWRKYLNKHLTDEKLGQYFQKNRRKLDGTRIKVAHLLLSASEETATQVLERAESIRERIVKGEISWRDAVREHSIAKTTSNTDGKIGWVTFRGPMSPEICSAAIDLNIDEISQPIRTPFGVHLIKCLQIEPGSVQPDQAKQLVMEDATRHLFESISRKHRRQTRIEYQEIQPQIPVTDPSR